MSAQVFRVKEDKLDQAYVTTQIMQLISNWIEPTVMSAARLKMLLSHIKAMVSRAETGEELPEIDATLFDEISEKSIDLAHKVVALLPALDPSEAYLLSVHFEVAFGQA
ncbi:hypothetical protein AwWohl_02340 [Gammaproteobacteria bacterium]|nr:hypothetical protein AwWohl_02340 [Gammaproteobacteria bacterium]